VGCLLENVSEFRKCRIYTFRCFEFPFAIYLVAYLRFVSVPISTRVVESGRWSFVMSIALKVVMIGVWSDDKS